MNIFGVGIPELLMVLLLAAIIFGPGRLPEFAGQFGRAVRELREYARDFRDEYLVDFEEIREEMVEVRMDLEETDQDIRRDIEETGQELRLAVRDAEDATAEAVETAKGGDEGPDRAEDEGPAASKAAEARPAMERRVRRRPIVRRRAAEGGDGPSSAPARPSNVIALRRRRGD